MRREFDAFVIGGGPAGAALAIGLAREGWRVGVAEQHEFPRRKVCGESLAAGGLELLDELGVGTAYRRAAGPQLDRVGWMGAQATVVAPFPPCPNVPGRYGRALGREVLDGLLLGQARDLGAEILQPVRVRTVSGGPGRYECLVEHGGDGSVIRPPRGHGVESVAARVVVAAHGSWSAGPLVGSAAATAERRPPLRARDLFAFKANFRNARLAPGLLAVLAFPGGYGGIVEAEEGRTTLACCIRRDALQRCRDQSPGLAAGMAVERLLMRSVPGVSSALAAATREGPWLAVGPIRPGVRLQVADRPGRPALFRVGNAAGESHPLIGEGIAMALQSAVMLTQRLAGCPPRALDARRARRLRELYAADWHAAFDVRLRMAQIYAAIAMRAGCSAGVEPVLRRWPGLLTEAARWAGKASRPVVPNSLLEEPA